MASKTRPSANQCASDLLHRPAKAAAMVAASAVIVLIGAVYCSGYEALTTGYDNWPGSLLWAGYALLPWYLLFEWIRRREHQRSERLPLLKLAALMVAVGAASLFAEQLDYRLGSADPPPLLLSLLRRTPGIAITIALVAVSRILARRPADDGGETATTMLNNWRSIRWIGAADNYLEIHYPQRVATVRMTMRDAERKLAPLGFVRIHRSAIVNRAAISAMEGEEVRLIDGQTVPVGKAFAANLRAAG